MTQYLNCVPQHIDSALVKMSNLHELSLRDNEIVEVSSTPDCLDSIQSFNA